MDLSRFIMRRFASPVVGLVFTVLGLLPARLFEAGDLPPFPALASVVLLGVTIALSSRFPRVALSVAVGFLTLQIGLPFGVSEARDWPVYLGPAFVVFLVALNACPRVRLQGLGAAIVLMIVATVLYGTRLNQAGLQVGTGQANGMFWLYLAVEFSIVMVGAWLVGFGIRMTIERFALVRERASAVETIRQAELKLTVVRERNRISRELHDVLAHSLAVIAAQADGTRYLAKDQSATVTAALTNISGAARSALIDAQRVIENVTGNESLEVPSIEDVDNLIDQMRHGHLAIDRTDQGDPRPLTARQELTVYRIVQESLTNALKHAGPGSEVTLRFNWHDPGLTLHVTSAPGTTVAPDAPGQGAVSGGRGIGGLRDRVATIGGWLTAEVEGRSFITTAFIPYAASASASTAEGSLRVSS